MLDHHELGMLRDIERRLRWESPGLARLLNSAQPHPERRKRARMRMAGASAAFAGLALLGPRILSEAEVRARRRPPLPRRMLCDTTAENRTGPVAVSTSRSTAVDLYPGAPSGLWREQ